MKMTDAMIHGLRSSGFTVENSAPYKGAYELDCLRKTDDTQLVITIGHRSGDILRVSATSPSIGRIVRERRNISDFVTTVKCGCVDCVKILKEWGKVSDRPSSQ